METPKHHTHLPDTDRLSTLAALILLSFILAQFIEFPGRELSIQLPGLYFGFQFGVRQLVALLVALLTASGASWLYRSHPHLGDKRLVEHWLLPGITTWAIGLPLLRLPLSPAWWIGFVLGGILLILVLVAEYIVIDPEDVRRAPAAAGLTALSFALFLVLATTLHFSVSRLILLLPALGLAVTIVSLRTLRLRIPDRWAFLEAGIIMFISIQIAAALHYWPLNPVSFGLALLGPTYALTNLFGNLAEGEPVSQAVIEPLVVLAMIWIAAVVIS